MFRYYCRLHYNSNKHVDSVSPFILRYTIVLMNIQRYRRPRSEKSNKSSSSSSESDGVQKPLPPGRPYITKVNGRLVMARDKRPGRPAGSTIDLLGSAFGLNTRIIRRARSLESLPSPTAPLMIAGVPYAPPQQQLTYSTPLVQNGFQPQPPPNMYPIQQHPQTTHFMQPSQYQQPVPSIQPMQQEPKRYRVEAQAAPSKDDIEDLKNIHAHFTAAASEDKKTHKRVDSAVLWDTNGSMASKTTVTVAKHICANCGRIRSRKYHHQNPIKPGESPTPAFCRKCQRDASSTSSEDRISEVRRSRNGKKNGEKV